jgi:hypothetical protein
VEGGQRGPREMGMETVVIFQGREGVAWMWTMAMEVNLTRHES